jgi:RsiW-degrading membrane proteinase PrsW (M82 family)
LQTLVKAVLRQLSNHHQGESDLLSPYDLSSEPEIVLGRDPSCHISLDPALYAGVSRRHILIRRDRADWEICDLNSANGTYINKQRLRGCRRLRSGDRIRLGKKGPEFVLELEGYASAPLSETLTFTQLFPLASTARDLTQKAYLLPAIATIVTVALMFAAIGHSAVFNVLLAAYLSGAAYYYIYRLCGKAKPWWVLLSCTALTAGILVSPILSAFIFLFRDILPGQIPLESESISLPMLLVRMFVGAGLMEELLKALPLAGFLALGKMLDSPWNKRVGIYEPLDGILFGAATAVGFTLIETLGQYVPNIASQATFPSTEANQLLGLQLLIPRILGAVAGHMAYSGYFGYFIGLSVLKPRKRWRILLTGYLTAALLHALWNVTGYYSALLLAVVGVLSYAFLAAAILKARLLSPPG